jgi:hypothetical protein
MNISKASEPPANGAVLDFLVESRIFATSSGYSTIVKSFFTISREKPFFTAKKLFHYLYAIFLGLKYVPTCETNWLIYLIKPDPVYILSWMFRSGPKVTGLTGTPQIAYLFVALFRIGIRIKLEIQVAKILEK